MSISGGILRSLFSSRESHVGSRFRNGRSTRDDYFGLGIYDKSDCFLHRLDWGVVCCTALADAATFVILKLVDATVGLRVSAEEEDSGLDLTQYGESAYND